MINNGNLTNLKIVYYLLNIGLSLYFVFFCITSIYFLAYFQNINFLGKGDINTLYVEIFLEFIDIVYVFAIIHLAYKIMVLFQNYFMKKVR